MTSCFGTFLEDLAKAESPLNDVKHTNISAIRKILFTNINYIIKHIEIHDFFIVYYKYDKCNTDQKSRENQRGGKNKSPDSGSP